MRMTETLTAEEATELIRSPDSPPHSEIAARLPSDVEWDPQRREYRKREPVTVTVRDGTQIAYGGRLYVGGETITADERDVASWLVNGWATHVEGKPARKR
jgi:hypothetical protein